MQDGGCHPGDGCYDGRRLRADGFAGADFGFLAANVVDEDTREPFFAAVRDPRVRRHQDRLHRHDARGHAGHRLAGRHRRASSSSTRPRRPTSYVRDAAQGARRQGDRRAAPRGRRPGAARSAIDAATASRGRSSTSSSARPTQVDLFITGHTHQPYNCVIDERPVTSAASFGRLITDIDLTLDRDSRDISSVLVNNKIVTQTVTRDAGPLGAGRPLQERSPRRWANRVIGWTDGPVTPRPGLVDESPLGNVIADAQLRATRRSRRRRRGVHEPGRRSART